MLHLVANSLIEHSRTAFSSQAFRITESYLEVFPRDGRAFLGAEGRALNLDGRVAAVRLLRQGEAPQVKRRNRNLRGIIINTQN